MAEHKNRKSESVRRANQVIQRRTVLLMIIFGVTTFSLLFAKLYYLQIVQHEELQEKAVAQQTSSTVVNASRGTIYDHNGNILAISATAETIFLSPAEIAEHEQDKALIASGLSEILDVKADTILDKMERTNSQYEILKRRVEQDIADQVRTFITENKLRGIYLAADSKRYYPYGSLAAQVLGFVGMDNTGLYGLEAKYDSVLQGTTGLTVTAKNGRGTDMLYQYEQYYDAQNGDSLVLTIDTNIQYYLEKGMENMIDKFDCDNGAVGLIMNPKNGAVLAMASYPNYDLNNPSQIQDPLLKKPLENLDKDSDEYLKALGAAQLKQWRNKTINDTYEPGSTFKPITLAAALEEDLVTMNSNFYCSGSVMVPGWSKPFHCSRRTGHGSQTLKEAVAHSCNPAFIDMGLRIGTDKYYEYLKTFGLMEPTGVDLIGETAGIFAPEKLFKSNVVSLASYAFGQTFTVTPLEVITAQAACINGGYLNQPYLVEEILDDENNVIKRHDATPVRQVVSEDTSAMVRECLEFVVTDGSGKNGQVTGYRVGGKTGTADKTGDPKGDVVVSFMCFAPADDPEVLILIAMDSPSRSTGTYVSGGNMVAPTCGSVLGDILPYLGFEPDYTAAEMVGVDTTVPNVIGSTENAAAARLKRSGFTYQTVGDGDRVTDQTPAGGAIVPNNAYVLLYMGTEKPDDLCKVPKVVGLTASEANRRIANAGLIMKVTGVTTVKSGNVYAINQSLAPETEVKSGTVITVQLGDSSVRD